MFKNFLKVIIHSAHFLLVISVYANASIFPRFLDFQSQQFLERSSEQNLVTKTHKLGPIKSTEDLTIEGPYGPIPLRIYIPLSEGPFPVVLYFPGGGWIAGDLDSNDSICRAICNQATCLIVSVNYHKAPKYPFPHALNDVYSTLEWTAKHIQNFNGNPSWIAVSGDSAGGNLAAALTLLTRDRNGPHLRCQVLMYPVTNFCFETFSYYQNAEGYCLTRQDMKELWKLYLQGADGKNPYASPLQGNLKHLPPAFILTAEFDPLRDEGFAYAKQLEIHGVAVKLKNYPTIHAFLSLASEIDLGRQGLTDIASYLKEQYHHKILQDF